MYGAILGDIIGEPYEFDRSPKVKEFPLFADRPRFTDDSVMTIAVAEALMDTLSKSDDEIKAALVKSMQKWGKKYPNAGYGGMFSQWLRAENPEPYGSFGNGSAMRASSAGWLSDTIEGTRRLARLSAEVTHNHPEGVKGAEATASAIFLARCGSGKDEIKEYITREFGYDLSRTCDDIRPTYRHVETCQQTVPEAITAFLEGTDFEDVIRTAVSLGGDCDTLTCIAGGIAEAFYKIPVYMMDVCYDIVGGDMLDILNTFDDKRILRKRGLSPRETVPRRKGTVPISETCFTTQGVKCVSPGLSPTQHPTCFPGPAPHSNPPREVIKEAIENDMIDGLDYDGIKAVMFARCGAMGCPGELRIFSLEGDKVYLRKNNYFYGDFNFAKFCQHFKPLDTLRYRIRGELVYIEDGWQYINLTVGNHLMMTDEVFAEFNDRVPGLHPRQVYPRFEPAILEILRTM